MGTLKSTWFILVNRLSLFSSGSEQAVISPKWLTKFLSPAVFCNDSGDKYVPV